MYVALGSVVLTRDDFPTPLGPKRKWLFFARAGAATWPGDALATTGGASGSTGRGGMSGALGEVTVLGEVTTALDEDDGGGVIVVVVVADGSGADASGAGRGAGLGGGAVAAIGGVAGLDRDHRFANRSPAPMKTAAVITMPIAIPKPNTTCWRTSLTPAAPPACPDRRPATAPTRPSW